MAKKLTLDELQKELKSDTADAVTAKKAVMQVKKAAEAIKAANSALSKSGKEFADAEE